MAIKISQLVDATSPLDGSELLELVQAGVTKKTSVSEISGFPGTSLQLLGDVKVDATVTGADFFGSFDFDGDPDFGDDFETLLFLKSFSGFTAGSLGFDQEPELKLTSFNDEGQIHLIGTVGGAPVSLIECDPTAEVILFYAGNFAAWTNDPALGGFEVNNLLTGAGFERVLTESDVTASINALFFNGDAKVVANDFGGEVYGSSAFNGNPNLGEDQDTAFDLLNFSGEFVASMYFAEVPDLIIENYVAGGRMELWAQQSGGGGVPMVIIEADQGVELKYQGGDSFRTSAVGVDIIGSVSNPLGGIQDGLYRLFESGGTTATAVLGFDNSPDLEFSSLNNGARVLLKGANSGGVLRTLLEGTGNGGITLRTLGQSSLVTNLNGAFLDGNLPNGIGLSQSTYLSLRNQTGAVELARLGFQGNANLEIRSLNHGASVILSGESSGGALRTIISGDPDGSSGLRNAGVEVARTLANSSGGLEVSNTLTGAGFERVLTESDLVSELSSYSGTITGVSSGGTGTIKWSRTGNLVTLYTDASVTGVSNTTAMTLTGMPASIRPAGFRSAPCALTNASGDFLGSGRVAPSGDITFFLGYDANVDAPVTLNSNQFTNSGNKGVPTGWVFTYNID